MAIGGQDYLALDQSARRLYVTHGTQVDVVNIDTEQPVGKIDGMNGVHGVALAPKHGHGFITSGLTQTVKMFDLKTLQSLADIPVSAEGPDGIVYEPTTNRVFAFEHFDVGWNVATATVETDAAQFAQIRDILIHHCQSLPPDRSAANETSFPI